MPAPRSGASAAKHPQADVTMHQQLAASGFALVKRVPSRLRETPHILILCKKRGTDKYMAAQYPSGLFTSPIPVTMTRIREIEGRG